MKYYGKAEESVNAILTAFETGNVPTALAQVFIARNDESPCRAWSWRNQLLVALSGFSDARGFKQWKAVARHVSKGQHARCHILVPITVKTENEKEDDDFRLVAFTSSPVFGLEQTEGKDLPVDPETDNWLRSLPLRELAESWGLMIQTYNGAADSHTLGYYSPGSTIALGVRNLSTWAHELCHASDDRLGDLHKSDRSDREIVAELAGATLLECMGMDAEADRGAAWSYIQRYADQSPAKALTACNRLLERVCRVVDGILTEASALEPANVAVAV